MRVGTYNVLGLTGYPKEEAVKDIGDRLSETAAEHFVAVFQQLGCDILVLQEGVPFPQIQRIAHGMGMNLATIPSPIAWPGHVLTRYDILESRTFSHTTPDSSDRPLSRMAGAALVSLDGGKCLWVVGLHLHPGQQELRDQEADILRTQIQKLLVETDQMIVMGDFNCEVHERIHKHLKAMGFQNAMEEAGDGLQLTMDTVGINHHTIDHIYTSPSLVGNLQNARVVRDTGFRHDGPQMPGLWVNSDHLPVIAELDLD